MAFETGDDGSGKSVEIEDKKQFKGSAGVQERWTVEMQHAEKFLKKYHRKAQKAVKRFLDEREAKQTGDTRLNLYTSTIELKQALLLDKPPKSDISRRFADADDQVARCSADILERIVNTDVERTSDNTALAVNLSLEDWLVAGLACMRARYVMKAKRVEAQPAADAGDEEEQGGEAAPGVPEHEEKEYEDVEAIHMHWRDFRWSPCKTWPEARWVAFAEEMSKKMLLEHFDRKQALEAYACVTSKERDRGQNNAADADTARQDPWKRVLVWEIWSKEDRKVYHWVPGMDTILKEQDDPLELEGFWPMPRPMMSHTSTSGYIPKPDWAVAEDLYEQIDNYSTRIALLLEAVRVTGCYDKEQPELQRLVEEADVNELYPVDNWAMLAEKGGLKGVIDFFPLGDIITALDKLTEKRSETINLLYQIDGTADIMRGQATESGETATASRVKSRSSSVRIQRAQNELARFVTEFLSIKAEIVSKLYDDGTIIARSNIDRTPDGKVPGLVAAAIKLLREEFSCYRIAVRPEALAMTDFDAVKQDRTEFMDGVSKFLAAAGPLMQSTPKAAPALLEMLKHFVAGFRDASQLEGILDRAIDEMKKDLDAQAQNPQGAQDPTAQALQLEQGKAKIKLQLEQQKAQIKGQSEQQHAQLEAQTETARTQAEAAAKDSEREKDFQLDMKTMEAKEQLDAASDQRRAAEKQAQERQRLAQQPRPVVKPTPGGKR